MAEITGQTVFTGRCAMCEHEARYTPLPGSRAPRLPFMNVTCRTCGNRVRLEPASRDAEKPAAMLVKGDVILHSAPGLPGLIICKGGCYFPMQVKVTVLSDAERGTETVWPLAGRPCIRVRGRREDTGAEGYLIYGPGAMVLTAVTS